MHIEWRNWIPSKKSGVSLALVLVAGAAAAYWFRVRLICVTVTLKIIVLFCMIGNINVIEICSYRKGDTVDIRSRLLRQTVQFLVQSPRMCRELLHLKPGLPTCIDPLYFVMETPAKYAGVAV